MPTDNSINKSVNTLEIEVLLKSLEQESSDKEPLNNLTDVERFISLFNITPGNYKISNKLAFDIFKKWNHKTTANSVSFAKELSRFIPNKVIHSNSYFFISIKELVLKQQVLDSLEKELKQRQAAAIPKIKFHFNTYLKKYDIKKGSYYLPWFVLYYLYDKYVYNSNKTTPLGKDKFIKLCELIFKKKSGKTIYFGVTNDILKHISLQEIKEITEGYERSKTKKETKTKKKQD